jgi:hypothetical protein
MTDNKRAADDADIALVLRDAMATYANSIDTPDYAVRVAAELSGCADGGKGEAVKPVCWITREQLYRVEDEGEDAWVYWAETGHAAEPDEVPLYAAPQAECAPIAPRAPTFEAKHVSLKQKGEKIILTLELDGVEGAPRYAITPINPGVVRADADTAGAWQSIETAPKDGRMFLGWVDAVQYGESDDGRQFETDVSDHDFCQWREDHDGGYFENMMGRVGDASHITHWMPLPAAPGDAAGASNERADDAPNPSDKQEANRRDAIYRKALAMGDAPDTIGPDMHEHHFEVEPSSGIELCTYCRLSRVAANKAAPLAQSAERADADTAGAKLVPVEPTEEMMRAVRHLDWTSKTDVDWDEGYRVMIAAAPVVAAGASNERADAEKDAALTDERMREIAPRADALYTMDQMRDYADAFHRARVASAPRADADTAGAKPCEYCDVNYPYHDLNCPVSIAALAKKAYEAVMSEARDMIAAILAAKEKK